MSNIPENTDYCWQHDIRFVNREYLLAFYMISRESPIDAIDRWAGLIDVIEKGYNSRPPEFTTDLDEARADMDELLNSPALERFQEHSIFRDTVNELDECFKTLTFEHERPGELELKWYSKRILRKAGPEYYGSFDDNLKKSIQLLNM